MIIALYTDAYYLSEHRGNIRESAYILLTKKDKPDLHNGAILILSRIIKHVMSSASEAEIVELYHG